MAFAIYTHGHFRHVTSFSSTALGPPTKYLHSKKVIDQLVIAAIITSACILTNTTHAIQHVASITHGRWKLMKFTLWTETRRMRRRKENVMTVAQQAVIPLVTVHQPRKHTLMQAKNCLDFHWASTASLHAWHLVGLKIGPCLRAISRCIIPNCMYRPGHLLVCRPSSRECIHTAPLCYGCEPRIQSL
jgi:hypothetical protein